MNFSKIYDYLQQDIDLDQLLAPILPLLDINQVLIDAGCGSGHILTYLAQKGFKVVGLDNDPSMLVLAQQKIFENELNAQLYEHDLREPLHIKAYQIISLLDVTHYFKGVKKLFHNYYQALISGGVLIIDLYKAPINEHEVGQSDELHYDWKVSTSKHQIKHELTVLADGHENHYNLSQYYYSLNYYHLTLEDIGFKVEMMDSYDDRKIYFICRK